MAYRCYHRWACLAGLICLGLLLVAIVPPAAACTPRQPDPWWEERLTIDDTPLPPEVTIDSSGYSISIKNTSTIPVYLLATDQPQSPLGPDLAARLPAGMYPSAKLVSNQWLIWQKGAWVQGGAEPQFTPPFVRHLQAGDDRPANITVPAPQQSRFAMLYRDQVIVVQATLSYALNSRYDTGGRQQSESPGCGFAGFARTIEQLTEVGLIVGVVGVIAWLGLWTIWIWHNNAPLDTIQAEPPSPAAGPIFRVEDADARIRRERLIEQSRLRRSKRNNLIAWALFGISLALLISSRKTSLWECIPVCANARLRAVDLTGYDLRNVDFRGANLKGANLSERSLMGTNLSRADLRGANLWQAKFDRTNLRGADLRGAYLNNTDLSAALIDETTQLDARWLLALELKNRGAVGRDLQGRDLRGVQLSGVDFSQANLSKADVSGTDLSGAMLRGVDARGANFDVANLRNADLRNADLRGANLGQADLSGADLHGVLTDEQTQLPPTHQIGIEILRRGGANVKLNSGARTLEGFVFWSVNLRGANLSKVNMRQVSLTGSNLQQVDARSADFSGARFGATQGYFDGDPAFGPATLREADLRGATLITATLSGVDLQRAVLVEANLQRANLGAANLAEADLTNADLRGTTLFGANARSANLRGAQLQAAEARINFIATNLMNADLRNSDLRGAYLSRADLRGADLRGADLRGADLTYANLRGAIIDAATQLDPKWRVVFELQVSGGVARDLRDADLRNADLRDVSFVGADLSGAIVQGALLNQANLRDARLRNTDLTYTDLSQSDLRGADLLGAALIHALLNAVLTDVRTQADRQWDLVFMLHRAGGAGRDLRNMQLGSTDLRGVDLQGADLRGADLRATDLRGANLRGANLRGALFDDANVRGIDLNGATFDYRQFEKARKDW